MSAGAFRDRLLARLVPAAISLSADQIERLAEYWRLLERWNAKINLTSLPLQNFPSATVDRLIVEPVLASSLMPQAPNAWYDVGSGGGSPAIPLKVVAPAGQLTMVESRSRKAAFLREVVRNLSFADSARVESRRIEEVASERPGTADCVTIRAVRVDTALSAQLSQLVASGAQLILFEPENAASEPEGFQLINSIRLPATEAIARLFVPRGTKG